MQGTVAFVHSISNTSEQECARPRGDSCWLKIHSRDHLAIDCRRWDMIRPIARQMSPVRSLGPAFVGYAFVGYHFRDAPYCKRGLI